MSEIGSDRDRLIQIIVAQTVSYDDACRIADAILDEGYGGQDDMAGARADGYAEAITNFTEYHTDSSKLHEHLLSKPITDEITDQVIDVLKVSRVITYGELWDEHQRLFHLAMLDRLKDERNPFDYD